MSDEFYVGYQSEMPQGLAAFLRPRVLVLVLVAVGLGAAVIATHSPFGAGVFEWGSERSFEGYLVEKPYPGLIVERPGANGAEAAHSYYHLVALGKHGAQDLVFGCGGEYVTLKGTLVYRDDQTMIEIGKAPIIVHPAKAKQGRSLPAVDLGQHQLLGEIVDSKCYLGVMKPGNLKPHRACAMRCISGGVPPVFLVRDEQGLATYFLLTGEDDRALNAEILDWVAVPMQFTGQVKQMGGQLVVEADPGDFYRL